MRIAWINSTRWALTSALLAVGAMSVGTPAVAQQRAGGDGRALDANQQVGSGGANPEREQLDYRQRNDVVTGNVGGGRSFRDDVGYDAPGDFRDSTGADDFFPFRRDAAGVGTGVGGRGRLDSGSVYGPYSSPHVARPRLGPGQMRTPWSLDGQGPIRSDIDLRIRPGRQHYNALDRFMLDGGEGNWLEISASPLLGVRSDVRGGVEWMDGGMPWRESPLAPDLEDPLQLREEDWQIDRSLRRSSLLDPRADELSDGAATEEEGRERMLRQSPTLMLGNQLRSQLLDPSRDRRRAEAMEQRITQLEEQMFEPVQSVRSVEPGEDVYMDLLTAMRGDDGDDERRENRQGRQADENGEQDEADDPFAMPEPLRGADAEDAEQDDGEGDAMFERSRRRAQALLDRLDHDLPPLETLAGTGEGQTNQMLREAEELLKAGRFFDAEALYREVVVREVDAPMARVGLTHAQLSAGMIRSSAMNLRMLFEQHPELIATRYEANLLPPADRQAWIAGELRRMMNEDGHAPFDAALLLAYLGYQQDNDAVIREGLDAVVVRDEHDGLLHVLRHIWLDEPDSDDP